MSLPRRTIDELHALFELEPKLADIFAEGPTDADIVNWFFHELSARRVKAYEIETIEIPSSLLRALGLTEGNRQRVIALAKELERRGISAKRASCVIDCDFDQYIPQRALTSALLLRTDFVSLELYVVGEPTLEKFLRLVLGDTRVPAAQVLNALSRVGQECYLIRLAHYVLDLNLDWVTPERCCAIKHDGTIDFDPADFLERLLNKNGSSSKRALIEAAIAEFRPSLSADFRLTTHGHDMALLLAWFFGKRNHSWLRGAEKLLRAIMGCMDHAYIRAFPLFQELESRHCAPA